MQNNLDFLTKIYFPIVAFVFGTVFGSFCNAWAWRINHNEKISKGRSHCTKCGHVLGVLDLIPLFSWLFLKGRCRYCGEKISPRYILAEAILGLYFLSIYLTYGLTWTCLRFLLLGCLLLICSLTDLETMEIPDAMMIAAAVAALLRLTEPGGWKSALIGCFAISVPLLLIVLLMDKLLKKETMGGGDIKLMAVLGLHFGAGKTLFILIVACVLGIVIALIQKRKPDVRFPFGPILALAGWITALIGEPVMNWYLGMF